MHNSAPTDHGDKLEPGWPKAQTQCTLLIRAFLFLSKVGVRRRQDGSLSKNVASRVDETTLDVGNVRFAWTRRSLESAFS